MSTYEQRAVWLMKKLLADFPEWGPEDAAACVGNGGAESNLQAVQEAHPISGRGGFGWFQWTGPRRNAFEAYCQRSGKNMYADETNYDYLFVELKGAYSSTVTAVAAARTITEKVAAFEREFEKPAVLNTGTRTALAERALKAYQATSVVTPPATTPKQPVSAPVAATIAAAPVAATFAIGVFAKIGMVTVGVIVAAVVALIVFGVIKYHMAKKPARTPAPAPKPKAEPKK